MDDEIAELRAGLRAAENGIVQAVVRWWKESKAPSAQIGPPPGTMLLLRDRNEYRERLIAMGEPDPDEFTDESSEV
jgi:hypothetical protein